MPLPIALPKHARSGATPYFACAPPIDERNPVMISSKIRSAPYRGQSLRPCKYQPAAPRRSSAPDDGRKLTRMFAQQRFDRHEVAIRCKMRESGDGRRYAEIARRRTDVPVLPAMVAEQMRVDPACRCAGEAPAAEVRSVHFCRSAPSRRKGWRQAARPIQPPAWSAG